MSHIADPAAAACGAQRSGRGRRAARAVRDGRARTRAALLRAAPARAPAAPAAFADPGRAGRPRLRARAARASMRGCAARGPSWDLGAVATGERAARSGGRSANNGPPARGAVAGRRKPLSELDRPLNAAPGAARRGSGINSRRIAPRTRHHPPYPDRSGARARIAHSPRSPRPERGHWPTEPATRMTPAGGRATCSGANRPTMLGRSVARLARASGACPPVWALRRPPRRPRCAGARRGCARVTGARAARRARGAAHAHAHGGGRATGQGGFEPCGMPCNAAHSRRRGAGTGSSSSGRGGALTPRTRAPGAPRQAPARAARQHAVARPRGRRVGRALRHHGAGARPRAGVGGGGGGAVSRHSRGAGGAPAAPAPRPARCAAPVLTRLAPPPVPPRASTPLRPTSTFPRRPPSASRRGVSRSTPAPSTFGAPSFATAAST
jgi:hypothetical protein